jgi:penicillin amidase
MYWTYTHIPNLLLEAFGMMNAAGDIAEFREGVSMIGAPGLNITYADKAGNIGLWSAAKQMITAPQINGKNYGHGFLAMDTLGGFYSFEHNPQFVNPTDGFLITANEAHENTDGSVYPGYYAPRTRHQRIFDALDGAEHVGIEAMKTLILDNVSKTEEKVAMEIAILLKLSETNFDPLEKGALEKLATWDGGHSPDQSAPTIYYAVLYQILCAAMTDEMGVDAFKTFLETHLFMRSYPNLIKAGSSPWWDDVNTPDEVESRDDIVVEAFRKAIDILELEYGKNLKYWEWGRTHTLEHPHALGTVSVLRPFFNVGPFPAPGGKETVNNAGFPYDSTGVYKTAMGPAMRILIDFNDVEHALSVLPTGNSGNVMSPHYDDQALLFVNGGFREMKMNEAEIKAFRNKLVISPK